VKVLYTAAHAKDFSCAHGGRHDCLRHVESQNHKKLSKSVKGTQFIAGCFQKQLNSDTDKTSFRRQVTRSEAMLCKMLVDLNQSINSADTFMLKLKDIFPDSGIAQAIQCGHSKTNAVIKEMSALSMSNLTAQIKNLTL
jgi:hypothetical protein